ncbi:MAG: NAD(P)-binding domain-containing protein [Myxococcales bacterium]|nr:NAD(P)-binding domain-containing protein [Myxococcales bacterium]
MRIAVIGAGPSGLVFQKELREAGFDAECFDAASAIGGVFARPYDGARLTSSNLTTSFSDLPPEDLTPRIWNFDEYLAYLNRYIAHFELGPRIHLNTPVTRLARDGEGFAVTLGGEGASRGVLRFDRVAICTGTHAETVMPQWPGAETFGGQIIHSRRFEHADVYAGKRVVIVGGGESGSDICLEVARVAAATVVSLRGQFGHLVHRNRSELSDRFPDVGASDLDTSRIHHMLPHWLGPHIANHRSRQGLKFARAADLPVLEFLSAIKLQQGSSSLTDFGTKNASVARAIIEHGCQRKPAIARFRPDGVEFIDGTFFAADVVICATGYRPAFPYLAPELARFGQDALRPRENLYRHCFHPELGDRVAFGGYARPAFGAIPPISEMQARWFALLCRGEVKLPRADRMRLTITADDLMARRQFPAHAQRLASLTDFLRILDQLAGEIGCRPEGLRFRDPRLWWKALSAPIMGAQFRLVGPGAKPEIAAPALRAAAVDYDLLPWFIALAVGGELLGRVPGLGGLRPAVPWI